MIFSSQIRLLAAIALLASTPSYAASFLEPGDLLLRHDLQLLNDSDVINISLTAWPLSVSDIEHSVDRVDHSALSNDQAAALRRIIDRVRGKAAAGEPRFAASIAASVEPKFIRAFEDTPRDEGEIRGEMSWSGKRFVLNVSATGVANPFDGDDVRPDGSYIGVLIGNWTVSAGWQERWWGPSRDGSLILSTNARPAPGFMLQRNNSRPFESRWLKWVGPWTLTTFMTQLDDDRAVSDALFFGFRGTFRPPRTGLEIGFSRGAQWCGDGRPCSASTFGRLLLGKDNQGVNVSPEDEPGNQRAGFDIRWRLPQQVPVALYMQWIAEDGRGGGEGIGLWNRQLGAEVWGRVGSARHRTHVEVSDTLCRQGGFGFSEPTAGCAYHHSIYSTGYRYRSRVIGHAMDGDGLSYSIGTTIVRENGDTWNVQLRDIEINREGSLRPGHTVSATPTTLSDLHLSHERSTSIGRIRIGLAISRWTENLSNSSSTDVGGFLQWSTH